MARIVGVHGIAQQYQSGPERSHQWLLALRGGLEAAGFRTVADGLTASELRVAFYGDLFRPPGATAREGPRYTEASLGPAEAALLTAFYEEAVALEPKLRPPAGAMAKRRPPLHVMLDLMLRSRTFAGVAKHALIGDLKQVNAFLEDESVRRVVLDRLAAEVSADVQVIIGHSLGSVVAYEFCCQRHPGDLELLITLGSPLGIPRLIFDRLTPAPKGRIGVWPTGIARWVNVADRKDVVALRKELSPLFSTSPAGVGITDRGVDNGKEPHDAARYLNSRQTGAAAGAVLS